jgi:uncharacterized protein YjdB
VVATVLVTPAADTLIALGQTQQLSAVAVDASGTPISGKTFTWESMAPSVATVSTAGLVTAIANGQARITATVDDKSGQASLTVAQEVASVTVTPPTASLTALSASQQFGAVAKDGNNNTIAGARFVWLSSNHNVATIDSTGLATAAGPGSVTITAAARGLPGSATLSVTQAPAMLAFTVQPTSATIEATISPAVQVEIQDAAGVRVSAARAPVTLAIGTNPGGGSILGTTTVNAVDGIASFSGLGIPRTGRGYTLVATSGGLPQATSATFDVILGLIAITTGGLHSCGLTRGGAAYCWGGNAEGELGDATAENRSAPVPVSGGLRFTALSGGDSHTCGLTPGGPAYCWGVNSSGQLGHEPRTNSYVPVLVSGGLNLTALSVGTLLTCGLRTGGAAYCWGYTYGGSQPVQIAGGQTFTALSAGLHACGLTTGGAAYCWGSNGAGQLGDSTTTSSPAPVLVSGGRTFIAVSASANDNSCGVATGGAAYCWGDNSGGKLGNGTTAPSRVPVPVSGGLTFVAISAGPLHTCGLATGGAAYCWGANSSGQLGNGTTTGSSVPVPVSGGLSFATVSAGFFHTCGVTTGGAAYCWGYNYYGQLGDGSATGSSVPVPVPVPVSGT